MRSTISIFVTLLLLISCKPKEKVDNRINYLIEFEAFQKIATQPQIKLIDFRKPKQYNDGHIPSAINIWRSDIEDHAYPYKGMIAKKETIEQLFSALGIHPDDLLIVYDDNGLCDAARFWWVLQQYGHTNIRLLHGSYSGWKEQNGAVTTEKPEFSKTDFRFKNNASSKLYIGKEAVSTSLNTITIVDTRTPDEFSGKRQKKGAFKGGRVPTSISINWTSAIDYHNKKRMRPINELDSIYGARLPSKKDPIIVYCHTGVRSAHTIFVLTQLLGYENVKNYDGSWSEWSYFNDLPFEQDSITTILK
ncbi:sulfurtransferase [Flavobacteriaceae bacterium S356]|uniref:Sulfurtransferase n=1 Tax=Asprobacillus argus TaxID=3076534 RepID=A0ABU3LHQ2_9FLAO|nr:sulfurtransferase [Flavobacteriaceae bacterium S356]